MDNFADLPSYKQLDEILQLLKDHQDQSIPQIAVYFYKDAAPIQANMPRIKAMMDFLYDEKYVEVPLSNFKLTFLGMEFLDRGGYTAKLLADQAFADAELREKQRVVRVDEENGIRAEKLNNLTGGLICAGWAAATGTGLLAGIELWKLVVPFFSHCCH